MSEGASKQNTSTWRKLKKLLIVFFATYLGFIFLRLLYATQRWEYQIDDPQAEDLLVNYPVIIAFWHNQQLAMPRLFTGLRKKHTPTPHVMISKHTDGRVIAGIMKFFNIGSVAGSSTEGGKQALLNQIELVKNGQTAAITPDGPRGPIYKLKKGVIYLAMATGAPIIPMSFHCEKFWTFSSWDRMVLPKPFTKGKFVLGSPVYIPANLSEKEVEQAALTFEQQLNQVTGV